MIAGWLCVEVCSGFGTYLAAYIKIRLSAYILHLLTA
jgi:hypothetical protein